MAEVKNEVINFYIPGMTVFALMILVATVAGTIVRDKERGFLPRPLTLPFTPSDFIFGYSLPFLPVIVVQVLILIGVGIPLGLKIIGNLGLAFLIFFLIGLNCLTIGMILGSLAKNEEQAEGAPWMFLVPLAMLSGAWFSIDMMPDILIDIMNALPFIHAIDASRSVTTYGATLADVLTDLYWLIGWAIVLLTAGIILFRRRMIN